MWVRGCWWLLRVLLWRTYSSAMVGAMGPSGVCPLLVPCGGCYFRTSLCGYHLGARSGLHGWGFRSACLFAFGTCEHRLSCSSSCRVLACGSCPDLGWAAPAQPHHHSPSLGTPQWKGLTRPAAAQPDSPPHTATSEWAVCKPRALRKHPQQSLLTNGRYLRSHHQCVVQWHWSVRTHLPAHIHASCCGTATACCCTQVARA